MINAGHVVADEEIWILYLFNLCRYRASERIRHHFFAYGAHGHAGAFRKINIPCHLIREERVFSQSLKKMDVVNFHWRHYDRCAHELVKRLRIDYLVTLYEQKELPADIPRIICPFDFIKDAQSARARCTVIHAGIDPKVPSRHKSSALRRRRSIIAPDVITQGNDSFWMAVNEILLHNPGVEIDIIRPPWQPCGRIKAVEGTRRVYQAVADAVCGIYTPYSYALNRILNSLHFLLRSMAMGTPCVASRNSAVEEIVRHRQNGILVPVNDPLSLAGGVSDFLNNAGLRNRCAANAQGTIREEFDLTRTVAQYENALLTL